MSTYEDESFSPLTSSRWTCKRCGCIETQPCQIEVIVRRPNGEQAILLESECAWSTLDLCTACDERLLPELKSLLGVWCQLGAIAMFYRNS
jgi:hypothetical protein